MLSPECWKVTLRVLGCLPPSRSTKSKAEVTLSSTPYRAPISLSPQQVLLSSVALFVSSEHVLVSYFIVCQQVDETVDWLSDYFLRSRLSKPELRSFGLFSAWVPYISYVVTFWEHLIGCVISVQVSSCARESVGSGRTMKGDSRLIYSSEGKVGDYLLSLKCL